MAETVKELEIAGTVYPIEDAEARQSVEKLATYSLTETPTGKKWINNKPIYRGVFEIANTLAGAGGLIIPQNYIEDVVAFSGHTEVKSSMAFAPCQRILPFAYYGELSYTCGISVIGDNGMASANEILIQMGGDFVNETEKVVLIFEYTKRTA